MCIEDSYIHVLEQLNDSTKTINKIRDLVIRTMAESEEERDYSAAFDELFGILMSDNNREWIDRCG